MTNELGAEAERPTDADRSAALDRLQASVGRGELTLGDYLERLDAVYAALDRDELAAIAPTPAPQAAPARAVAPVRRTIAFAGDSSRRGRWDLVGSTTAVAVCGSVLLDLRQAYLPDDAEITMWGVCGSVEVLLPQGIEVSTSGGAFAGSRIVDLSAQRPHPGAPRLRIRMFAFCGVVEVRDRLADRPVVDWMRRVLRLPPRSEKAARQGWTDDRTPEITPDRRS